MFNPKKPDLAALHQLAQIPVIGRSSSDGVSSPYPLPNTIEECTRLDFQHFILRHAFNTNYFVPFATPNQTQRSETGSGSWTNYLINKAQMRQQTDLLPAPQMILDVGCGTGRWAIETARQFPEAKVIGIDLHAPAHVYTDHYPYPTNCTLAQGNILQRLSYADGTFDYVHMRCLSWGIPAPLWQPVMNELGRLTAPGGWVESVEWTLAAEGGPALLQIQAALEQVLIARGIDLSCGGSVDGFLRRTTTPFGGIRSQLLDLPMGINGGGLGERIAWNMMLLFKHMEAYFLQGRLFGNEEFATLLKEADSELQNTAYHPIQTLHWAYGHHEPEKRRVTQ